MSSPKQAGESEWVHPILFGLRRCGKSKAGCRFARLQMLPRKLLLSCLSQVGISNRNPSIQPLQVGFFGRAIGFRRDPCRFSIDGPNGSPEHSSLLETAATAGLAQCWSGERISTGIDSAELFLLEQRRNGGSLDDI